MLVFIIVGAVFFILSFVFGRYRKKLRKEHIKAWNKALKYMRYTSLALIIAGLLKYTSRSQEHTSELQSRFDLVCRLLLETKELSLVCCALCSLLRRCQQPP